ncbi:aldehyde dehydrogenase family protein [Psychrosphaera sp. F3M07]|uniref:aldehyde dehydrogenase family protein n=1 Tax=Psychrosphaera sp. F3M07 TaxID=2841560 RepID=UPI001C0A219A|nr:aldehyde dehydrogenase family protein [Psychrosphaera sp. F3M07]MBU2916789.1 aldehyde dehydrogenase family protein [Psychrosphaera sp. F3M07]
MCKTINSHYVNGAWVQESKPSAFYLKNPSTGLDNITLMLASNALTTTAIESADLALPAWQQCTPIERATYIADIVVELKKRRAPLIESIMSELGCPRAFTAEVQVDAAIEAFEKHVQRTIDLQLETVIDESLTVYKEAIGVCSIITPWNYPLHQLLAMVAPALAAGCTMVVKPSKFTPTSAILLAQAIEAAKLPKGVFNLIIGSGRDVGPVLTTHPLVKCVSFSGSPAIGQHIQKVSAQSNKKVLLDLGGKSPYLICPTKNLAQAVNLGIEDVMANSGQTYQALTRMYVHESQIEQAKNFAKQATASINIGEPDAPDTFMGPVLNQTQLDIISSAVQGAENEGAEIICGGARIKRAGYFFEPTVIANLPHASHLAQQQILAPVIILSEYKSLDDVIRLCNDTPDGLITRIWGDDIEQSKKLARKINATQTYIYGPFLRNATSYGRYHKSGDGRSIGSFAIDEFFEIKSIIV